MSKQITCRACKRVLQKDFPICETHSDSGTDLDGVAHVAECMCCAETFTKHRSHNAYERLCTKCRENEGNPISFTNKERSKIRQKYKELYGETLATTNVSFVEGDILPPDALDEAERKVANRLNKVRIGNTGGRVKVGTMLRGSEKPEVNEEVE